MRVRVLKDFASGSRTFRAGEVVEINPRTESTLLSTGLVMQDKSLDGAMEMKAPPLPPPGPDTFIEKGFARPESKRGARKRPEK